MKTGRPERAGVRLATAAVATLVLASCAWSDPDAAADRDAGSQLGSGIAEVPALADPTCALGAPPEELDPDVAQDPVEFEVFDDVAVMTGTIGADFVHRVCDLAADYSGVAQIEMLEVPGSSTPGNEALQGGLVLRAEGYDTYLPGDGIVESGGVDVFLAGRERVVADGGCLGVHSTEIDLGDGPVAAADLPRDDPEHAAYLEYFEAIGIPPEFYWFTIEAAPPDGIHYLTPAEMVEFGVVTGPPPAQGCALADDRGGA